MHNQKNFKISSSDLEFFSKENTITIVPNFTEPSVVLIVSTYGPFRAQKPIEVPLWLAIYLKNRSKCSITIPPYYCENYLNETLLNEKNNKNSFCDLPENFFEIFQVLFENSKDDFEDSIKSKSLIEDIKQIRISKLNFFVNSLEKKDTSFILNNISEYELNIFRPLLSNGYDKFSFFNK